MRQVQQHIAGRSGAIFPRPVGVRLGHRRIVAAVNRDRQCRGVFRAI